MRTFHTGGVAGDDITQGLPRIQEVFEARNPKGKAIITEIKGTVTDINSEKDKKEIIVQSDVETKTYTTPYNARIKVEVGDAVEPGEALTEGSIDPKELIVVQGTQGVQEYLLKEVQKVYRMRVLKSVTSILKSWSVKCFVKFV